MLRGVDGVKLTGSLDLLATDGVVVGISGGSAVSDSW